MGACSTSLLSKHKLLLAIIGDQALTAADIRVAAMLLEHVGDQGYAYPSLPTIEKLTTLPERTVRRSILRLSEASYFRVGASGGRGLAKTYRPNYEKVAIGDQKVATHDRERWSPVTEKVRMGDHPYLLETRLEESKLSPDGESQHAREAEPTNGSLLADDDQPKTKRTHRKQIATSAELEAYQPDQRLIEWVRAACRGVDPLAPSVLERWRNHHLGKGTIIRDLNASYRTWLLREPDFASYRPKTGAFVPKSERQSPHLEAIARLRAAREAAAQRAPAAPSQDLIGPPIIDRKATTQEGNDGWHERHFQTNASG